MSSSPIQRIDELGFPWSARDPFLFCAYHKDLYPTGDGLAVPKDFRAGRILGNDFVIKDGFRMYHGTEIPGFPAHPHRGFETITCVRRGWVDHADSLGATARYGAGDTQWLTTGRGIQHSEMFPLLNDERDNPAELFQIWLNLPASSKAVEPYFRMFWHRDVPKLHFGEGRSSTVEVVAGQFAAGAPPLAPPPSSWASQERSEVAVWIIELFPGAPVPLPSASADCHRDLYFYEGKKLLVANREIQGHARLELAPDQKVEIEALDEPCRVLVLQGKPIAEPVVQHGPFVVNRPEQIHETLREYQKTRFGGWQWDDASPTHGNEPKRFAHHPDGTRDEGPPK